MTHETFQEMLPLYVIGALDGDELYHFEQYAAENRERCEPEIAEFQSVADQLAQAAPTGQPSPEVYRRVMAAIEESERPAQPAPVAAPARERMPIAERREPEGVNWLDWIIRSIPWAAAAVLVVLLISANGRLRQLTGQLQSVAASYNDLLSRSGTTLAQAQESIADLTARLEVQGKEFKAQTDQLLAKNNVQQEALEAMRASNKQLLADKADLERASSELREQIEKHVLRTAALQKKIDEQAASLDLVMDPAIRVAQLADPKNETKAVAKVYWHDTKKTGVVVVSNLSPVVKGQGKCLELWAICGSEAPVPAGIGWTDGSGHGTLQVKLDKELACIDKFAVSVERAAGVAAPEGPIVLIGQ